MKITSIFLFSIILFCSCERTLKPNEKRVTREMYGKKWPFIINEGIISCSSPYVFFEHDGKIYPMNGKAKMDYKHNSDYSDINDIWKVDPDNYFGINKPYSFLVTEALLLCDN